MLNFSKTKILIIYLLFVVFGFFSLLNIQSNENNLINKKVNLGLDLQGGSYLLLEINTDPLIAERIQDKVLPLKKLLKKNEKLIIDGCHSIKSAKNLFKYLKTLKIPIYGIWGMKKNKLPINFIKSFNNIFKKIITVTIPNEPSAIKNKELKDMAKKCGNNSETARDIKQALNKCSNNQKKIIVIFGSLYLAGYALKKN